MKGKTKYVLITVGAAFAIIIIGLILNIVGVIHIISSDGYEIEGKSDDEWITSYVDSDGQLSVNIYDPGEYVWRYDEENSTEELAGKADDFDGYHFLIKPASSDGMGYAVVSEYEGEDSFEPHSVGITKFKIEAGKVTEILDVAHIASLSEYDFE